jgi:hypothetical protein
MAIVKLTYLRRRPQLKAHLRYITHRRGRDGERITRPLFDARDRTDKQYIYALIDAAPRGTIFYKMMINLDPKREDTRKDIDLPRVTRHTIRVLEARLNRQLPFAATVHNADHTPLRHMHGMFLLQGRLSREQFRQLRQIAWATATAEARRQRRMLDLVRENPRLRFLVQARSHTQARALLQADLWPQQGRAPKPLRLQHGCYHCGYGQFTGIPSYRLSCPSCHRPLTQENTQRVELARQL